MNKILQTLLPVLIAVLITSLNACKKDNNPSDNENDWLKKMDELQVSDDFNYKSTKTINLNIKLPFTVDYSDYRGCVDIMTGPENAGGEILNTGSVNQNGIYDVQLTVPSFHTELYIRTHAGNATIDIMSLKSNNGVLDGGIDLGENYDTIPPADTSDISKLNYNKMPEVFRTEPMVYNSVQPNLVQNGDFEDNDFGTIPYWYSPMVNDGKWYISNYFHNSAGQYSDNGNMVLKLDKPTGTQFVSGGVAQLINASQGDLITFSADIKSFGNAHPRNRTWIYIIPRRANGSSITYYSHEIFPVRNISDWENYTVSATMPYGTETVQILFWNWIYRGSVLWDNAYVTGPVTDSDGDGVDDEDDDYPDDPTRAYNIYYPDFNSFGSLAYEDNWPGKGDYDFNDLVVDYQYKQVTNAENELVELFGKFVIRAIGASYTNGFGFEMDLAPTDISDVTGISIVDGYITLGANNSEANQAKGTIIVTDNAFTQLPHPGGGTGVNTTPGQTYVEPDTMEIHVTLTQPVSISEAGSAPYNPFIIVDQERGREVHLPDYTPTSLANPDYFGTMNDDSNPATGKYYKTENNLPWAIDVPAEFDYPIEKAVIIQAYLHFAAWAESSGSQYPDWYLDLSGYRNDDVIYQVP